MLAEYPEHEIKDPFKEKILAGLKRSLWCAGVAQVENANEKASSYGWTWMPFKPDLLFGYNGVKRAVFINNSFNGKSRSDNVLNCQFTIIENQDPNIECITVPVEAFLKYDLETLKTEVKDFDVEKFLLKWEGFDINNVIKQV